MGKFNDLPKEITSEILTRLPIETVLDCKLVCKPWRDFVNDPSFSQRHFNYPDSGNLSFIFFDTHTGALKECTYVAYDDNSHEKLVGIERTMNLNLPVKDYSLIGSCNGLIFFSGFVKHEGYEAPAYICNPVTREYAVLPDFEGNYIWAGFGYSSFTNEYKVVVVRIRNAKRFSKVGTVEVYTLGSGNGWRNVGTMDIDRVYIYRPCTGVFLDGALHWMDEQGTLVAFDLTHEKFIELPSTPCLARPQRDVILGVLGGFLIATYFECGIWDIWLLRKDKDNTGLSWSKELSLEGYIPMPLARLVKIISRAIPHKNTLVSLKVLGEKDVKSMESCGRASSSEVTESRDKLKKPQDKRSLGTFLSVAKAPIYSVSSIISRLTKTTTRYLKKTHLRHGS